MEKIREARIDEFDELLAFLAKAYGYAEVDWFATHYGNIYQRDLQHIKNSLIIKDKDRIVSHVGLFPLDVLAGKGVFKVVGIGGVATDPAYRGQGLMGKLLKYAIDRMQKEEYAFSVLWGDRQRYGNFGWELGGRRLLFTVTSRSLASYGIKEGDIRQYDGKEKDLEKIITFHERERLKVKRSKKTYQFLMKKAGTQVWLSKDAYMVLSTGVKFKKAIETGGNPSGVLSLALTLIKEKGLEGIRISRPYEESGINREILNGSVRWWVESLCSIKIINFPKTLEGFQKAMQGKDNLKWPENEKELVQKMSLPNNNLFNFYIWSLDHV